MHALKPMSRYWGGPHCGALVMLSDLSPDMQAARLIVRPSMDDAGRVHYPPLGAYESYVWVMAGWDDTRQVPTGGRYEWRGTVVPTVDA